MTRPFEILEHTADIGFRAWGEDVAELFVNSARAMMAIAAADDPVTPTDERVIEIDGEDYESLLVNWLSELLYLFDADEFAAADFKVEQIGPRRLKVQLKGERRDPLRHRWKLIVKAVTYHRLAVNQTATGWEGRVFLDI